MVLVLLPRLRERASRTEKSCGATEDRSYLSRESSESSRRSLASSDVRLLADKPSSSFESVSWRVKSHALDAHRCRACACASPSLVR